MSRYDVNSGIEGEFEPGSRGRVLRNLQGIQRAGAMHRAEFNALLKVQRRYLALIEDTTRFDAALLCTMHGDWLGAIYPWAGRYRHVEVAKGNFRWPPAMRVAANMREFEAGLLRTCTPRSPGPTEAVAEQVAQVHAEFLLIHPFREGNGRMARWLADLMIAQAGLPAPDYGFEGKGSRARRARYLEAVIRGYGRDYAALRGFFMEAIARRLRGPL